jgi:hypothetical protein
LYGKDLSLARFRQKRSRLDHLCIRLVSTTSIKMDDDLQQRTREAFARRNANYDDPGATIMWFGRHKGQRLRLDQLDEGYRRSLLRIRPYPSVVENVSNSTFITLLNQLKMHSSRIINSSTAVSMKYLTTNDMHKYHLCR